MIGYSNAMAATEVAAAVAEVAAAAVASGTSFSLAMSGAMVSG